MSLWVKVDRKIFENDITTLVAHSKYQDQRLLAKVDRPRLMDGIQTELALSEQDECQLADDIAFLTCVSQGRDGVTAAAIQHFPNKPFLRVTVSANGGVPGTTETAIKRLFVHLGEWSRGESTREDTLSKIQTTVVTLHRDRMFDRLGIRKEAGTSQCMIEKPVKLILSQVMSAHAHDAEQTGLHRCLEKFQQALQQIMESEVGQEEQNNLVRLLRCANKLMDFQGTISEYFGTDWMRQLHAVANYHRMFHSLLTLATRAKVLFGSIKLFTINPPSIPRWKQKKKIVHAEIQILAHFEQFTSHRPRYIRASKRPCYLCYLFMHGHGIYNVPKSHGEVFKSWGLEDNYNFSKASKKRMITALRYTADEVTSAVCRPSVALPRPMYLQAHHTASKNILVPGSGISTLTSKVPTPSLTALNGEGAGTSIRSLAAAPQSPQWRDGNIEVEHSHNRDFSSSISSTCRPASRQSSSRSPNGADFASTNPFKNCHLSSPRTICLRTCGLELFVEVEGNTTTLPQSYQIELLVELNHEKCLNLRNIPKIHLDKLFDGQVTFEASVEKDTLQFAMSIGQQDYILRAHQL